MGEAVPRRLVGALGALPEAEDLGEDVEVQMEDAAAHTRLLLQRILTSHMSKAFC